MLNYSYNEKEAVRARKVYLVVTEIDQSTYRYGIQIERLVHVIEMDLSQFEWAYENLVKPLINGQQPVRYYLFDREPPNPFHRLAEKEQEKEPAHVDG